MPTPIFVPKFQDNPQSPVDKTKLHKAYYAVLASLEQELKINEEDSEKLRYVFGEALDFLVDDLESKKEEKSSFNFKMLTVPIGRLSPSLRQKVSEKFGFSWEEWSAINNSTEINLWWEDNHHKIYEAIKNLERQDEAQNFEDFSFDDYKDRE